MPAESRKIIFPSTLNHAEAFLQTICCDQWYLLQSVSCSIRRFPVYCPALLTNLGFETFFKLILNLLSSEKQWNFQIVTGILTSFL